MHQYSAVYRCAIHSPLNRLFDYLPPETVDGSPPTPMPGQRLWVPFGKRRVVAMLLEVRDSSDVPPAKMRHAEQWIDSSPLLDSRHLELLAWISDYYHHPLGDTLFGFLPPLLRKGRDAIIAPTTATNKAWRLTTKGKGLSDNPAEPALKRAPKQAELIKLLQNRDVLLRSDLKSLGINLAVVRTMRSKGLIEETIIAEDKSNDALGSEPSTKPGIEPNSQQREAINAVLAEFTAYK